MSFSALDFLTDVQHRLSTRLPSAPNLPTVDFLRVVNFMEHRFVVRVVLGDEKIGEIQCREVEEPQDCYIRGVFCPADPTDSKAPFTVRRDKTYESETEFLTGALLMRCFTAISALGGPLPPPPPPPPPEPEEPKSFVIPGANFDPSALFGATEEVAPEPEPEPEPKETEPEVSSKPQMMYDDSGQVISEPVIPDQPFDPATLFGKNPAADSQDTPSGLPPPPFDPAALFGGGSAAATPEEEDKPEPEKKAEPIIPEQPFDPAALFGSSSSEEEEPAEDADETESPAAAESAAEQEEKFPPPPFDPVALFGGAPAEDAAEEAAPPDKPKGKKKPKAEDDA
jgi:hypothetical protein